MAVNEGVQRLFSTSIASAATSSAEIDLGAHFSRALVGIPTSWTGGNVRLEVAENTGGTYKALYSTVSSRWEVASSISGAFIPVETVGRYIKVETDDAPTADSTFYVVGVE